MLNKGKGLITGKLQTIQLIEADLQLLMRICISNRMKGKIENDKRISKANYGSWLKYSINNTILEKWLIYDQVKMTIEPTVYNMTDLEACYDHQNATLGGLV